MPNVPEYAAVLYGPIMLAAETGAEDLQGLIADDQRWSHIAHGRLMPLAEAPMLVGDPDAITEKITPVDGEGLRFKADELIRPQGYQDLRLEPFFRIHDARYIMYWHLTTPQQYQQLIAEQKQQEQRLLQLDSKTVDRVIPGEQQPEADHNMQSEGSEAGVYRNRALRHVRAPGWFSYDLRVDPDEKLALMVLYWGNENADRQFDILIDGQKLVTEDLAGKWNQEDFVPVFYPVPESWINGKESVTVTFRPRPGNWAGGIFDLRMVAQ